MKLTEEMMGDWMDEAMEDDELEEEQIVDQVLDEIGIEMNADMRAAPTGAIGFQSCWQFFLGTKGALVPFWMTFIYS